MGYTIGAQVPLPYTVRDGSGTLVDVATMTITVVQPDGTSATPLTIGAGITRQSLGTYLGIFTPSQAGRHTWSGVSTTPATALEPDAFNVTALTDAPLVGLAEARSWLGIDVPDDDPLIRRSLAKATELAEWWTGETMRRTTVTETHPVTGKTALQLWQVPAQSVTTVVDNGSSLTGGAGVDWILDTSSGLLYRGSRPLGGRWVGPTVVTYVAGYTVVPDRYLGGVEELTRHLFSQLQDGTDADRDYTADAQVRSICALHLGSRVGGFA